MSKYRIRQVREDKFAFEYKGLFFWGHLAWEGWMDADWPIYFASEATASAWLNEYLEKQARREKYNSFKPKVVREI